jgi:hypothetical protein
VKKILKMLGVPPGKEDQYLRSTISELIDKCIGLCTPQASYSVFSNPKFNDSSGLMHLEDETFQLNKMVTQALCKSTEVVLFVCTCGSEVESYANHFMKEGQALEGYIADLIGSEIAEGTAEFIHIKIESDMATYGLKITNRYSPGYCNWPVSDQQQLFALFGENNCAVQLSESSLMLPIKSVSGIIGAGKNVKNRGYRCTLCDTEHCLYRDNG